MDESKRMTLTIVRVFVLLGNPVVSVGLGCHVSILFSSSASDVSID